MVFHITIGCDLMPYIFYTLIGNIFYTQKNPFLRLRQLNIWWIGNKKDAADT